MQIANLHLIEKFKRVHASAASPMKEWVDKTTIAAWKTPMDVKRTFASVSFVKDFVIFNVGGNKYRLLTQIYYMQKFVDILKVGTHTEYDRWKI